jgi:hypothetical protein
MKEEDERHEQLLLFGFKNLMLEGELAKLERSGIEIGHVQSIRKDELVDTDLFEHEILQKARKMADFYALYFSMENSVRKLITDVLREKHGSDWWEKKVPEGIKDDNLAYTNFGELTDIFNSNWNDFADILRSRKSVQDTLCQFNNIRNIIAHSCELNDDEIVRFKLLIKDWLRIQQE